MSDIVAAAVSGGVDSLMAAFFLKDQGLKVVGLHFVTGYEPGSPKHEDPDADLEKEDAGKRLAEQARRKIQPVSDLLDIPVHVLDVSREFEKCVVDDFVRAYKSGRTPNPCLVCNPSIKFGVLFEHARRFGASRLATGHYARIAKGEDNRLRLFKGLDKAKDQSYFLGFMTQKLLGRACFPLGDKTKDEVKRLAEEKGLAPAVEPESQDVCFIREGSYGDFLSKKFSPEPGEIANTSGKVIGEHQGLHLFTIGQRRGINCPAAEPYYVVRIDTMANRLIVGFKGELFASQCRATSVNWLQGVPESPFSAKTRVRYRHKEADSLVVPTGEDTALVRFENPQEAITPGQGAVFYIDDEVVGAGWIASSDN